MKEARLSALKAIPIGVFLITLLLIPMAYAYFPWGDINGDGWCNIADLVTMTCPGTALACSSAADMDGDGEIRGSDVTYLVRFLRGLGGAPVVACPSQMPCEECDESAIIWLGTPVYNDLMTTATIPMYIASATSEISSFHFALKYDQAYVSSVSISLAVPGAALAAGREFCQETGERILSVGYQTTNYGCDGIDLGAPPPLTHMLNIVVNVGSTTDTQFNLCITDDDPVGGPARLYKLVTSADNGKCFALKCRFMVAGDINGDEVFAGSDITYGVRALRGVGAPAVSLNCLCIPLKF